MSPKYQEYLINRMKHENPVQYRMEQWAAIRNARNALAVEVENHEFEQAVTNAELPPEECQLYYINILKEELNSLLGDLVDSISTLESIILDKMTYLNKQLKSSFDRVERQWASYPIRVKGFRSEDSYYPSFSIKIYVGCANIITLSS